MGKLKEALITKMEREASLPLPPHAPRTRGATPAARNTPRRGTEFYYGWLARYRENLSKHEAKNAAKIAEIDRLFDRAADLGDSIVLPDVRNFLEK